MEHRINKCMIAKLIKENNGYITRKDIDKHNIPSIFLSRYVKENKLVKYCAGFYAKSEWIKDDYLVLQYQHPKFVYSFYSAAYLHGLIDSIPVVLEVTVPKNHRPFNTKRDDVKLHTDTRNEIYNMGIVEINTIFGNKVNVYDIEKTICDFIRNRTKIDSESFVKCINSYKKRSDRKINNLMEYAKKMRIEKDVYSLMEVILNEN